MKKSLIISSFAFSAAIVIGGFVILTILTYFADKGDEDAKNRLKEMQEQGK